MRVMCDGVEAMILPDCALLALDMAFKPEPPKEGKRE